MKADLATYEPRNTPIAAKTGEAFCSVMFSDSSGARSISPIMHQSEIEKQHSSGVSSDEI